MRDISLGDTIDIKFNTSKADGTPATLAGDPAVAAYVGNSTTEITAGITLTVDQDSRTGMHNVRVVANSGNGFTTATDVALVLTSGTVDGVSVAGVKVGEFTIGRGAAYARLGAPAGASVSADIAAVKSDTGAIKAKTDNLPSDPADQSEISGAISALESKVDTIDNVVDAIKAKTDNLPSDPADQSELAGAISALDGKIDTIDGVVDGIKAVTDNLPDSGALSSLAQASDLATVDGIVDDIKAVTEKLDTALEQDGEVYRFTANALEEGPAGEGSGATAQQVWEYANRTLTANPGLDAAGVRDAVGLSSANLDTQLSTIDGNVDDIKAVTEKLDDTLESDEGTYRFTADALAEAPAAEGGLSASAIAEAVRTELTDELGRLDVAVSTRLAGASYSAPLDAAGMRAALGLSAADLDTQLGTIDVTVDGIKAKTDQMTFTVPGCVDANIQTLNEVPIVGDGTANNKFTIGA